VWIPVSRSPWPTGIVQLSARLGPTAAAAIQSVTGLTAAYASAGGNAAAMSAGSTTSSRMGRAYFLAWRTCPSSERTYSSSSLAAFL